MKPSKKKKEGLNGVDTMNLSQKSTGGGWPKRGGNNIYQALSLKNLNLIKNQKKEKGEK